MTADLNQVLGFNRHIALLTDLLEGGSAKRLAIRGPSGTGKTRLAQSVSTYAEDTDCNVVWLRGDAGRTNESFYPIQAALRPTIMKRWLGRGARLAEGLAEDFLPKGKATAKAFISLLPQSSTSTLDDSKALTDAPRDFTSMLARLLKRNRMLIVADDIQYFDSRTLALLEQIFEPRTPRPRTELRRLTLLVTVNTEIHPPDPVSLSIDILAGTTGSVELAYCSKAQFGSVLQGLGLAVELPASAIELLYDCSGGHLHIANFIVDELKTLPVSTLDATSPVYSDLLHFVIQRRLGRIQPAAATLLPLLYSAAHIGRSFSLKELICLTALQTTELRQSLHLAESLHFVEREDDMFRFTHEVVRSYFVKRAAEQRADYSAKYSECLRILRPADYYARSVNLLNADDLIGATVAHCQGLIAEWRAGTTKPQPADDQMSSLIGMGSDIPAYLTSMYQAHILLADGDFRTAQLVLAALNDGIYEILTAERDYLLAESLLKDLGASQTEEARRVLMEWDHIKDREPELWCRMHLLLLLAYVQLGRYDDARRAERTIVAFLSGRAQFDPGAKGQLHRLLVVSEMHSSGEIARRRIGQACTFYERELAGRGFTDLYGYFICLTNRSGNAITTGDYARGIQDGIRALAICRDYPVLRLPARWAAANNVVVAAVLDRRMPANEGARCLRELSARFPRLDDDLLINANAGALEILVGRLDAALHAFSLNRARLESTPDIDPYYRYLSESNRAIALHLAGESEGKEIWDSCASLIEGLAPACRADLRTRHDMISPQFCPQTFANLEQWRLQIHRIESSEGRYRPNRFPDGVFFSDIQIWSSI